MRRYMLVQRVVSYLGKNTQRESIVRMCVQRRQLDIPVTILRHLLFIPRIQHLYMTEESVKQMTWHKKGK
jgi:hypothetical protein